MSCLPFGPNLRQLFSSSACKHMPAACAVVFVVALCISSVGCKEPPRAMATSDTSPLPSLGEVPAFTLKDQRGASITRASFDGAPWVANTFFTSCRTICPNLMSRVSELHDATASLAGPVRLVSITVDPDNDTPDALANYHREQGASERWSMLTGEFDAIRHLVVSGFHTAMGKATTDKEGTTDITHSGKLFLVDGSGMVRGYYPADDVGLKDLQKHLEELLK